MASIVIIPPALAATAQGRASVTTAEFAKATARASQTIRKTEGYRVNAGIRPVKIGGRLGDCRYCRPVNGEAAAMIAPNRQSQPSANKSHIITRSKTGSSRKEKGMPPFNPALSECVQPCRRGAGPHVVWLAPDACK